MPGPFPDVWPMLPPISAASRLTLPNVPMPMPRPQMLPQAASSPQNGLLDQFMLDRYARMGGMGGMGGMGDQSWRFGGLLGLLQGNGPGNAFSDVYRFLSPQQYRD